MAAVALGLTQYDPALNFAGVIINKVASPRHREEVLSALEGMGLPILGVLPRDAAIEAPSRHLGLVPVEERADANATMERLASQVSAHIDLDALIAAARSAPELDVTAWNPAAEVTPPSGCRPVVAVAGGRAFTFRYPETVELLEAAGCRVQVFDPAVDDRLPENTAGIYLGGGFPEVHAAALASRADLRREIADFVVSGGPVVAECAGMLYLSGSVDATGMVGAIPGVAAMGPRLTLGYRRATTTRDGFYARAGRKSPDTNSTAPRPSSLPAANPAGNGRPPTVPGPTDGPGATCTPPIFTFTGPGIPSWPRGSPRRFTATGRTPPQARESCRAVWLPRGTSTWTTTAMRNSRMALRTWP